MWFDLGTSHTKASVPSALKQKATGGISSLASEVRNFALKFGLSTLDKRENPDPMLGEVAAVLWGLMAWTTSFPSYPACGAEVFEGLMKLDHRCK